jgi:hypothetical protein
MSDREKFPELIDRFNTGQLTGEELTAFLEILKTNPRLREEVRLDSELNEILANEDILELRQKILTIQENRKKRKGPDLYFFLLAASFLLLMGVETLLFMNYTHPLPAGNPILGQKQKPALQKVPGITRIEHHLISADTVKKGNSTRYRKTETMLAASFRKNPSFENMIGSTRHAGYFRMDAPVIGCQFNGKDVIGFTWSKEGDDRINILIMDNNGTNVHESGLLSKNNYSIPPGTLKKGLYYFKVLQNDEILLFGKFFVE